jgi:hypothetical protein
VLSVIRPLTVAVWRNNLKLIGSAVQSGLRRTPPADSMLSLLYAHSSGYVSAVARILYGPTAGTVSA